MSSVGDENGKDSMEEKGMNMMRRDDEDYADSYTPSDVEYDDDEAVKKVLIDTSDDEDYDDEEMEMDEDRREGEEGSSSIRHIGVALRCGYPNCKSVIFMNVKEEEGMTELIKVTNKYEFTPRCGTCNNKTDGTNKEEEDFVITPRRSPQKTAPANVVKTMSQVSMSTYSLVPTTKSVTSLMTPARALLTETTGNGTSLSTSTTTVTTTSAAVTLQTPLHTTSSSSSVPLQKSSLLSSSSSTSVSSSLLIPPPKYSIASPRPTLPSSSSRPIQLGSCGNMTRFVAVRQPGTVALSQSSPSTVPLSLKRVLVVGKGSPSAGAANSTTVPHRSMPVPPHRLMEKSSLPTSKNKEGSEEKEDNPTPPPQLLMERESAGLTQQIVPKDVDSINQKDTTVNTVKKVLPVTVKVVSSSLTDVVSRTPTQNSSTRRFPLLNQDKGTPYTPMSSLCDDEESPDRNLHTSPIEVSKLTGSVWINKGKGKTVTAKSASRVTATARSSASKPKSAPRPSSAAKGKRKEKEDNDEKEEEGEKKESVTPIPTPKRRGRPSKKNAEEEKVSNVVEEEIKEQEKESEISTPSPVSSTAKKTPRSAKRKTENVPLDSPVTLTANESHEVVANKLSPVQKRPRSRVSDTVKENVVDTTEKKTPKQTKDRKVEEEVAMDTPDSARGGRKRKAPAKFGEWMLRPFSSRMSASSVSWNADAGVRYERLAAEYAKLRSHAGILMNGVLEERTKNEKLTEEVKSKESSLRKLRAEHESLLFRNEQLTKRVQTLQTEVEQAFRREGSKREKSSKKEVKLSPIEMDLERKIGLLEEELDNKMKQNMKMVGEISEMERVHSIEMTELSDKFAKELRSLEDQLSDYRIRESSWITATDDRKGKENGMKSIETAVVQPLRQTLPVVSSFSMNGVSVVDTLPSIQPPPTWEAYRSCFESARLCMSALSTFLHLYAERTELFPYDSSMEQVPSTIMRLTSHLNDASILAHNVSTSIQTLLQKEVFEISSEMTSLVSVLSPLCLSLRLIISGMTSLSIEESKGTWSNGVIERLSSSFYAAYSHFVDKMELLIDTVSNGQMDSIEERLHEVAVSVKELRDSFCARWQFETRLPVATRKLQCVCGALSDCLTQLNIDSSRLASRVQTARHLPEEVEEEPEVSPPVIEEVTVVEETTPSHVPSSVDLVMICQEGGNRDTNPFGEGEDSEVDTDVVDTHFEVSVNISPVKEEDVEKIVKMDYNEKEITSLRSRICELESERERLLVEIALLKRRSTGKGHEDGVPESDISSLKQFYNERIRETFQHLQEERERVRYLTQECSILLRRVKIGEEEKKVQEGKMKKLEEMKEDVEDELATVRRGYETQLNELSQHMAELNGRVEGKEKEQRGKSGLARKLLFRGE